MSGPARNRDTTKPITEDLGPEIRLGLIAILGFFVLFLGWAAFAPLDAAVVAPGIVTVAGDRQTVQHRDGGVISRLSVVEGQKVKEGDILIELGAPETVAQQQALVSQIVDLQMERARFDAETARASELTAPPEWVGWSSEDRAIAEAAFVRQQAEAQNSKSGGAVATEFGARIAGYRDEIAATHTQEKLLSEELEGMRTLEADQLVPLPRIRALQRSLSELQGRRGALRASIAQAEEERSNQVRRIQARLAELMPQLAAARAQVERTRIRSPASGVVVGLSANTVGGVLSPGQKAMDIVPQGQELIIEARVRPEDANDVNPNMAVEVKITAFKVKNLPIVHGFVRQISADRFVDEHTGEGYFLVQVGVPPKELRLLTKSSGRTLSAGLPAQIMVPTRKRTALQYFVEPLNQTIWRSFRES